MAFARPRKSQVFGRQHLTSSTFLLACLLASCNRHPSLQNHTDLATNRGPVELGPVPANGGPTTFEVRRASDLTAEQKIDTEKGQEVFKRLFQNLFSGPPVSVRDPKTSLRPDTLVVGFPMELLGQNYVFGGVVTSVSAANSETLGGLKLSDLPPLHVRPQVTKNSHGNYVLALIGCSGSCGEGTEEKVLHTLPLLGSDLTTRRVFVDLSALGDELNLIHKMDPAGLFFGMRTRSSQVVSFEYSLSTLVFDVKVEMAPTFQLGPVGKLNSTFNVRWYLKLTSSFTPGFAPRPATEGVGYFLTKRSSVPKVTRFAIPSGSEGNGSIHYFVKAVPTEYQPAFAEAFEEWNAHLKEVIGKPLLTFEFVDAEDPRFERLVTGDVRYNIVEWDTNNRAPYGGLGPSIANQYTGEIFNANTLIQGPSIVRGYRKWFETGQIPPEAEESKTVPEPGPAQNIRLSLGSEHVFRIPAQETSLHDPAEVRDFEEVPEGMDFPTYMHGYFKAMVAHELGHNLGLRHNFRGSLGYQKLAQGAVSNSIMEYLNRRHRHLNQIGRYDQMAIGYAYAGKEPEDRGLFCTDEQVARVGNTKLSAECSKEDATDDPYSHFESIFQRIVSLVLDPPQSGAIAWKFSELEEDFDRALVGMLLYAASAKDTGSTWTRFYQTAGRPQVASEVPDFVIETIRSRVCDATRDEAIAAQASPSEAQAVLAALREKTFSVASRFGGSVDSGRLNCQVLPKNVFAR